MALRRWLVLSWIPCTVWALVPALAPHASYAASQEPAPTPFRLFANVEEAWGQSDAERLTSLLDTTTVRIALKPGAPLTFAVTRVAASFLLNDQLRLVHTRRFQIVWFDCDRRQDLCRARAVWTGEWGGKQGPRAMRVAFTARSTRGGWLLTEIRAED